MNTDSEQKLLGLGRSFSCKQTCTRVFTNSKYQGIVIDRTQRRGNVARFQSVGKTVQQFVPQSKTTRPGKNAQSQAHDANHTGWQKVASKTTGTDRTGTTTGTRGKDIACQDTSTHFLSPNRYSILEHHRPQVNIESHSSIKSNQSIGHFACKNRYSVLEHNISHLNQKPSKATPTRYSCFKTASVAGANNTEWF
jgi:hypothetical protein